MGVDVRKLVISVALAIVFGAVIGLALGLLGAGGSILAVPALVYGVGQPLATAIPTSLVVVAVSAIGGLVPRDRRRAVFLPVALVFGLAGVPAAFGGAALGRLLPDRWLLLAFAVLMVLLAARMLRGGDGGGGACRSSDGRLDYRGCIPKAAATGAVVGVLTGMFGVGGGFVIIPALTLLLGLAATEAVATSLAIVVINSMAGLAAHARAATEIDYRVLLAFSVASLVVSIAAARVGSGLSPERIRRWFAYLVLLVAAGVATSAIMNVSI